MGRPVSGFALALALCPGLVACDAPSDSRGAAEPTNPMFPLAPIVVQQSPILGGVPDTTDGAVMALVHQQTATMSSACTGTVIAKSGGSGILLTAGHCVVANNGMAVTLPLKVAPATDIFVIPGNDWQTALSTNQYFQAAQVAVHPSYDGSVNSTFDMALVRFVGATPSMPVIPALTPAEDTLAVGSVFTLVGYGETDTNKDNSQRRKVDRTIETLSDRQFQYNQQDLKGACSGDSGGPALVTTPNGLRVGGVTSYGDVACTMLGVSVRVSPLSAFIQSFISGTPLVLNCDECTSAAVSPGNACILQANACGTAATACGQFLGCADACTSNACFANCQTKFATGAAAYDTLAKCQCSSCATPCAQASACAPYLMGTTTPPPLPNTVCGGVTDPRPACSTCITKTCCAQAVACANDAICASCLTQSSPACRIDTAFSMLSACKATCAGTPCTAATSTGGTTGTAGTMGTAGTTGTAGATGAAGVGATAGITGAAGAPATGTAGTAGQGLVGAKSGCSCSTGGAPSSSSLVGSALFLAAFVGGRRRRR